MKKFVFSCSSLPTRRRAALKSWASSRRLTLPGGLGKSLTCGRDTEPLQEKGPTSWGEMVRE
jgi:hypothetical protein